MSDDVNKAIDEACEVEEQWTEQVVDFEGAPLPSLQCMTIEEHREIVAKLKRVMAAS